MKNIRVISFVFSLILMNYIIVTKCFADNYPTGSRFAGMANTGVMWNDLWSVYQNQAGLSRIEKIEAGVHFSNSYFVKELSVNSLAFAMPTKAGVWALNYTYFGYSRFNQNKVGFAYSRALGKKISIGMQVDYFRTHIEGEFGNGGLFTAEAGMIVKPLEKLSIGAHIFNPVRSKWDNVNQERMPTVLKVGLGYQFSETFKLGIEVEKDMDYKEIFKVGAEYELVKNLFFRIGISTNPIINSFGIGYKLGKWKMDISFTKHEIAGYSSGLSLGYIF